MNWVCVSYYATGTAREGEAAVHSTRSGCVNQQGNQHTAAHHCLKLRLRVKESKWRPTSTRYSTYHTWLSPGMAGIPSNSYNYSMSGTMIYSSVALCCIIVDCAWPSGSLIICSRARHVRMTRGDQLFTVTIIVADFYSPCRLSKKTFLKT